MFITNIENELQAIKNKSNKNSNVYDLNIPFFNDFDIDKLKSKNIYHISDIKKTCIDYRLRFLNTKYFKGDIPLSAQTKLKTFKKEQKLNILDLKIMAPSKLFKLKNADDPLLFCNLGNDYFYLIDKWGNDLSFFRKISMWPFKSLTNILFFIAFLSLLATLIIPKGIFVYDNSPNAEFFITYLIYVEINCSYCSFFRFLFREKFQQSYME